MSTAKFNKRKIRPMGKIHGGKSYLARRILDLYPTPGSYCKHTEAFGGLASVSLNLPPVTREQPRIDVYNDIDQRLFNLFFVLREKPKELQKALGLTPYSEQELEYALQRNNYLELKAANGKGPTWKDRVEWARTTYVLLQMSFGGQGDSFSKTKARTRRGIADVVSGHLSTIDDELPEVISRVREWQIENRPALEFLRYHDAEGVVHYLDPPYHPECRASSEVYPHEMSDDDHRQLLAALVQLDGDVVISHYRHKLYDDMLHGWKRVEFDIANHAAGGKAKRRMQECVWLNF